MWKEACSTRPCWGTVFLLPSCFFSRFAEPHDKVQGTEKSCHLLVPPTMERTWEGVPSADFSPTFKREGWPPGRPRLIVLRQRQELVSFDHRSAALIGCLSARYPVPHFDTPDQPVCHHENHRAPCKTSETAVCQHFSTASQPEKTPSSVAIAFDHEGRAAGGAALVAGAPATG